MRTAQIKVFKFEELSDSAKEKARDWYRENGFEYDWYEPTFETMKESAKFLGIDIDKIYFSGFSFQGDGACFEGSYSYKKGWKQGVVEHFGKPEDNKWSKELIALGERLQTIQQPYFYKLSATVKHSGHYSHEYCTAFDITCEDDAQEITLETEKELEETLRKFMREIYKALEQEHDYLTSDEAIDEAIIANEYEFKETGARFND